MTPLAKNVGRLADAEMSQELIIFSDSIEVS